MPKTNRKLPHKSAQLLVYPSVPELVVLDDTRLLLSPLQQSILAEVISRHPRSTAVTRLVDRTGLRQDELRPRIDELARILSDATATAGIQWLPVAMGYVRLVEPPAFIRLQRADRGLTPPDSENPDGVPVPEGFGAGAVAPGA